MLQTEISLHLLDGSSWNLVHGPQRMNLSDSDSYSRLPTVFTYLGAAMTQKLEQSSANRNMGRLISGSPHVEVSLGKIINPKLFSANVWVCVNVYLMSRWHYGSLRAVDMLHLKPPGKRRVRSSVQLVPIPWQLSRVRWQAASEVATQWIGIKCIRHISQRKYPIDFGDSPNLHKVPPANWHLWLRLKCPNNNYDYYKILDRHSCSPQDEMQLHW